ncbi:MAG: aminotransferase class V-fold PLP-dependent enzyme [Oscillospiraceae bacterium]|nr:aminotransferase class V-fold PLP-dependent enzyme [Oscillospiraceae bacterium]
MSNTPIYDMLKKYVDSDFSRFHMPGHKGNYLNHIFSDILKYDITEINGADSLYHADGVILQSEQNIAEIYGAKRTLFSAGGATLAIQTMLSLALSPHDKIIAGRNIHTSAVNVMALLDLTPIWVYPDGCSGENLPGRILAEDVEKAIIQNPDAKAVYITSPDYFGVVSNISAISAVCHRYNIPLLVDNSHGAHLILTDKVEKVLSADEVSSICNRYNIELQNHEIEIKKSMHPLLNGADMCVDSAHKTLPVLTGGAFLHIANERYVENAKNRMSMFGSTSPSYLIMLSLDLCCEYLKTKAKEDFANLFAKTDEIYALAKEKGFSIPNGVLDKSKITLSATNLGYNGNELADYLRTYKIEVEYASLSHIVLMPSPFSKDEDFIRLTSAIEQIIPRTPIKISGAEYLSPSVVCSIRDAVFGDSVELDVEFCENRVSAEVKSPCPPGVPIIMPGERIEKGMSHILKKYGIDKIKVLK